jgi:hypothetical protein
MPQPEHAHRDDRPRLRRYLAGGLATMALGVYIAAAGDPVRFGWFRGWVELTGGHEIGPWTAAGALFLIGVLMMLLGVASSRRPSRRSPR